MILPEGKSAKELSKVAKDEWQEWTKTVWDVANVTSPDHPAAFPVEIPNRLIRMFSLVGETVLDPFSGTGTTGVAALAAMRRYVGVEAVPGYAELSRRRIAESAEGLDWAEDGDFEVSVGSSRDLSHIPDDSVGVVVTSPPYWNKVDYGESDDNLGAVGSYGEFLSGLRDVMAQCRDKLMPGRNLCAVVANVNQNTSERGLVTVPIASDLTRMLQGLGTSLVSQVVWNKDRTGGRWGSAGAQRPIFGSYPYPPNLLFKNVNEFVVVARKADPKRRNPKAPGYDELFGDVVGGPGV